MFKFTRCCHFDRSDRRAVTRPAPADDPKMFYKPKFCCNCGERIQRAEWKILTSRRFCDVCGIENQGQEWLPRVIVCLGVTAGIFGLGSYIGGSRPVDQFVPLRLAQSESGRPNAAVPSSNPQPPITGPAVSAPSDRAIIPPDKATKEQPMPQIRASEEAVYYCGALTKKGKPCSRRVKEKGRCWQHLGQPTLELKRSLDVY